ncbi:hypothetical protein FQA39_LY04865 [Lamprigera yunnana]|nr:hypothetical protein FQA39_LY04865 [Lamprigera yunnana]
MEFLENDLAVIELILDEEEEQQKKKRKWIHEVWGKKEKKYKYLVAVSNKHVYFMFPYISDTGAMPPESCIMAQGFNIGAAIMVIGLYIRYRQIDNDIKTKNIKLAPMWNNVGMVFGCLGSFGLSLVGNFQETSCLPIHLVGAFLALGVGTLYISVQTWISFFYINARDRKVARLMFYVRLVLNVVMFPLAISVAVFALLAVKHYKGPSTGKASATLNDEAFDEDLTVDADSDSETASDQTDNSSENSTSFSNIAINDFIVVQLKSEKGRKIRFIGKVISIEPCRCQFLRASKKIPNGFIYPDTTDEGDIEADEFIGTLEPPEILRRGTLVFPPKQLKKFLLCN